MGEEGLTLSNLVDFVASAAVKWAILVGMYVYGFRRGAVDWAADLGSILLSLLVLPDVLLVAAVVAVVSALGSTEAFLDFSDNPRPTVVDIVTPGSPTGFVRLVTAVHVGFRIVITTVVLGVAGVIGYLEFVHPGAVAFGTETSLPAVLGAFVGAFTRPSSSPSSTGGIDDE